MDNDDLENLNRNDLDDASASRAISRAIRDRKPAAELHTSAEAVYGDTDMDPNADDQKSAHSADADEHV